MCARPPVIWMRVHAARPAVICTKPIFHVRLAIVRCLSTRQQMAPERFHLRVMNWSSCWLAPSADVSRTKRRRLNALTLVVCLALGSLVTFLRHRNHPISLCEISAHPERFAGKVVRVRALITRDVVVGGPEKIGPSEDSAFSACTGKKEWAEAYVTLDEVSGVS